jgi:hypothetical protein
MPLSGIFNLQFQLYGAREPDTAAPVGWITQDPAQSLRNDQ